MSRGLTGHSVWTGGCIQLPQQIRAQQRISQGCPQHRGWHEAGNGHQGGAENAACLCWSTVGCKANSIHVREQKLDGNGNGWKFIDCYWHLLNKPVISKCLDMIWEIAGSPFHVISCLDTLYCAETMRIRNSSTEPIVPIPRPPDLAEGLCHWNDMVGIPNLTISQNQDATMKNHPSTPGTGRTPMVEPAPKEALDQTQLAVSIHDLVEMLKGS